MICWHKWSNWSEPSVREWVNGAVLTVQERDCSKCCKTEIRVIADVGRILEER